ncbi:MAG: PAS domain-containing protein [Candidatus Microsaccharimonas sossegonensis]|uniref:histidine kinase n=1 Tax=Candidatus Microsaccharimonas sossegonensis TaxID=2506948 RepID=A0A4Q0AHH9_9BACT|nr:MAG: PAS domain-containing protein [Candidatus Microsaccharimonas sossegonensis]
MRGARITPLTLSRYWHRRIYEVAFLLSLAILALYVVPKVTNVAPSGLFSITIFVAVLAGLTAVLSVIFYLVTLKKESFIQPFIAYVAFAATVGVLVVQTGGTGSPFIMLWLLVAFVSPIFAVYGWLPMFIVTAIFLMIAYIETRFGVSVVAIVLFSSILPTVIGMLVWRARGQLTEQERNVKTLANELSEVANRSEIVINAIGDGVIAIDAQGTIQLINPAAQGILGWGKQDALALHYKSILQLTDLNNKELDPATDPIMQVLNTNQQIRSNTLIIKTKSGKKITSSLVVSPIGTPGSGVITVFRDMTKEKAEEQEQAEFISTASHEMRTPVASIEGYLGLALNPNTAQIDAKARDFIMKAHEAAQHLGHLFQDLLDVSKSEDGRMINNPKVVDMADFTKTIVQGLTQKATDKGLSLIYKPTDNSNQKTITPVFFVNQDNDHIREILDNLIENAIKYTLKGNVVVDVQGSDSKVVVSVKDSGLGIPTEDVPHLFQKFYRVDNQDRSSIGGTGLGLYLSRRLAEAMQGRLYLESVHGQGSTFFLELPRISSQEAEQLRRQQFATAAQAITQNESTIAATAPAMPPVVTPYPQTSQPTAAATASPSSGVKPATTVPRGESLSREQIQAHVKQLEEMARQMQTDVATTPPAVAPPEILTPVPAPTIIPVRPVTSTPAPRTGQQ